MESAEILRRQKSGKECLKVAIVWRFWLNCTEKIGLLLRLADSKAEISTLRKEVENLQNSQYISQNQLNAIR
jgi:hypothetical protein